MANVNNFITLRSATFALVRRGEITNHHSTAYSQSNHCVKISQSMLKLESAMSVVFLPREVMLSAVFAIVVCLYVCLSVRVSVCHTPVLYQNG